MILYYIAQYLMNRLFLYQLATTLSIYLLATTCLYARKRLLRFRLFEYYDIPGPKPRLLDGNLHSYLVANRQQRHRVDEAFHKTYGKHYGFFTGDDPWIVLTDLDVLKQVFLTKKSSFKGRLYSVIDSPMSHSIMFVKYERWRLMRKLISPTFASYAMHDNSSADFIQESIELLLDNIEHKFDSCLAQRGRSHLIEIDIHDLMKATALHMISSMAIKLPNVIVTEGESNVRNLDAYLSNCDSGAIVWAIRFPLLKRLLSFLVNHFEYNKAMKLVHQSLNSTIDRGLANLKRSGKIHSLDGQSQLIDTMIKLHYEGKMTRKEVMGNAEAILMAGYDTTSTTLSYIIWVLGQRVDVQEKLRSELMAYGLESKHLEQVINETMRRYPTVLSFVIRTATENVVIDDLTIPQGTQVVYNAWLMNFNPNIWPEPQKFDPERFREGVEMHPCAFAPFGLGERKCLGYQLAKLEMKMVIFALLTRYKIRTKTPQDLELISYSVVLTKPKEPIIIELDRL